MFGIGLGEIILILLIVFLIAPKEIPKILRRIAQLFTGLENLRRELSDVEEEVKDAAREITTRGRDNDQPQRRTEGPGRKDGPKTRPQPRTTPPRALKSGARPIRGPSVGRRTGGGRSKKKTR
jgi:Sec-independent protein translocase protein TatA